MDKVYKKLTKGRGVTLPRQICEELDIFAGSPIALEVADGKLVISASPRGCVFCGETAGVKRIGARGVCASCLAKLNGEE